LNEILLVNPFSFLKEKYVTDKRVALLSRCSIDYWPSNGGPRESEQLDYPTDVETDIDLLRIQSALDWLSPLFYRWIGDAADYEIHKRTCLLYVVKIVQVLLRMRPKYAIFSAGVAHHIEISLIELACQLTSTKQIYFYPSPFGLESRLIPIIQKNSLSDRNILQVELNEYDVSNDLTLYVENHRSGAPPTKNESIDFRSTSLAYASVQLALEACKRVVRPHIKKNTLASSKHYINISTGYSLSSLIRVLLKQRRALEFYAARVATDSSVEELIVKNKSLPILFSHFQPESTTFPEGGKFTNNIDLILEIRKVGYKGPILYKEHPASWAFFFKSTGFTKVGMYRSIEYYRQLEALGCVFVKNTFRMTRNHVDTLLPVTMTGSVAIERSLQGLVTCCSGDPWFKGVPGTYGIYDTFKAGGVFSDSRGWKFDSDVAHAWFTSNISYRSIPNYPGIGTGIKSDSEVHRNRYLAQFKMLLDSLVHAEVN